MFKTLLDLVLFLHTMKMPGFDQLVGQLHALVKWKIGQIKLDCNQIAFIKLPVMLFAAVGNILYCSFLLFKTLHYMATISGYLTIIPICAHWTSFSKVLTLIVSCFPFSALTDTTRWAFLLDVGAWLWKFVLILPEEH